MLLDSKSNLAKLMATENIIVEQKKVPTAHFNLKSRTLVIPILKQELSNNLYDLFIGHEVGHALNTPEQGWHDSIMDCGVNRSVLNVCEDVRIEKLIRRKFPGLKISFIKAYKELLEQDFFGINGYNLESLRLIDRINLHTKCGGTLGIKFNPEEYVLLMESENTETFAETVIIAQKIQDYMKEQNEKRKEEIFEIDEDEDSESEEVGEDEAHGNDEDEEEDSDPSGEPDYGSNDDEKPGDSDKGNNLEEDLDSITDNNFRDKEKELYEHSNVDYAYANVPNLNSDDIILTYKELCKDLRTSDAKSSVKISSTLFTTFRKDSSKTVSYLAKEFELRKNADQLKRAAIAKTGDLNMQRIYAYQFTDDIFKKITITPNGKSHGLVLFLDWSGSMRKHMADTIKQLMTLVMFCKMVQIPYEVYAFSTRYSPKRFEIEPKPGDLDLKPFALMNLFSSKMTSTEFSLVANALLSGVWQGYLGDGANWDSSYSAYSLGSTPLNETIVAALDIIPKFQSRNKLQVVNTVFLTDGEGHALTQYKDHNGKMNYSGNLIIRDPKTHVSMKADYNSRNNSKAFLHILKQRTQCNIIGFRIMNLKEFRDTTSYTYRGTNTYIIIEDFRKNKSHVAKSVGFDEYYMLKADSMSTDEESLDVKSTTTRGLVTAFKKYTKGNIQNKVILNRFIGLIS